MKRKQQKSEKTHTKNSFSLQPPRRRGPRPKGNWFGGSDVDRFYSGSSIEVATQSDIELALRGW